jgi:hypothetical protein
MTQIAYVFSDQNVVDMFTKMLGPTNYIIYVRISYISDIWKGEILFHSDISFWGAN